MDDGDAPAFIAMRMGVLIGGRAVCGPAGVAQPDGTIDRILGQRPGQTFIDFALLLAYLQIVIGDDGKAGTVIASIFKAPQTLEKDRGRLPFADVADDAAHEVVKSLNG